jgi:N-acetylglucosamine malate deacetylase 1
VASNGIQKTGPAGDAPKTILVALSHQDDEVGCAGTIMRHADRGDRVVLLWLTRGEMTEIFGSSTLDEVKARRTQHGIDAARLLGAEARFMDFPDTRVAATPEAAAEVAKVIADVRPDAVITWGDAWIRGSRHPDHQATGKIVRDAVTFARIGRIVAPLAGHRGAVPIFTIRDEHSTMPVAAVDITPVLDRYLEFGRYYRELVGWPPSVEWQLARVGGAGARYGVKAAELFEAWETPPGLFDALL